MIFIHLYVGNVTNKLLGKALPKEALGGKALPKISFWEKLLSE